MSSVYRTGCVVFCVAAMSLSVARGASPAESIRVLKSVEREGQGNPEAAAALRELTRYDGSVLPTILVAFDDASPLAANWLRSAVETIADRELKSGRALPAAEIELFLLDRNQNPRARRFAFECLLKIDETAADRLIPGMLNDPSAELRRDAVARLIDEAKELNKPGSEPAAADVFQKALSGAVDDDQVKAIVEPLRKLGHEVDLQRHFGFLNKWKMIGPFNNKDLVGFEQSYPPEQETKWDLTYPGQLGEVNWTPLSTDDDYGVVDIATSIKPYKGAVMYAAAEFHSDKPRQLEFRLGTPNAWKLWLNGELLFGREEYHRGTMLDQYRVPATVKAGQNILLLKVCQNEQEERWAQAYRFQLRVCNAEGTAIHSQPGVKSAQLNSQPTTIAKGENQ